MSGRSWVPKFVALAAMWGASFLFIKVAVRDLAPLEVAFGRCAIGAVTLLGIAAATRTPLPRDGRTLGHLTVAALLLNAVPFALFSYGETKASSVLAGIWNGTTPLFALVAVLAVLPAERPTPRRVAGLAAGFAGVVVVLGPWKGIGGATLGAQLMFAGAAACYGLAFAYTRRFLTGGAHGAVALAASQVALGALLLALALPFGGGRPAGGIGLDAVACMAALGALGTGVAYVLNYVVIREAGATTASTVTYVVPVFSTVLGVVVLGEGLAWHEPAGAAIVLAGVAVSQDRLGLRRRAGV